MTRLLEASMSAPPDTAEVECLHELFEMQADLRPEKCALICRDTRITYEELEQRSNQLARYLREHYVGPGKLVGIYFDRSELPIVSILAVLKAGAGYVPIDPVYPAERARHILVEAQVSVLLTEQQFSEKASSFFEGVIIPVDSHSSRIEEESPDRLPREETGVSPEDLCYVLYTSGTTGRPKGVMTEHRNVVRFTASFNEVNQVNDTDRVFQGFSLGFDGSVEEIWMAFSNGATLVVGTSDVVKFGDEVARVFEEEEVTVFSTVPTFLSMIGRDLPSVRVVIVSGEPCPPDIVQKWALPGRSLLNVYGPTETTVNTTVAKCVPNRPVTIGRPLRGYDTYILNEQMQPVSPGEPGELYIGGVGVARGYFNQPELTQRQFVPSPFNGNDQSHRLYRTGDLVRLTEDGDLDFMRRMDRQVKIRGYRIELSEIESVLRELSEVHQAVVNVFERDGLKELCAYVVLPSANGSFDRDKALQCLRDRVPPYMVPAYLDVIESIPTLASGKADRSRLPEPCMPLVSSNRTVVSPGNEMERKIAASWEKLFKVSPLSQRRFLSRFGRLFAAGSRDGVGVA
jgi:amino acid adenylation domain-containing protein